MCVYVCACVLDFSYALPNISLPHFSLPACLILAGGPVIYDTLLFDFYFRSFAFEIHYTYIPACECARLG